MLKRQIELRDCAHKYTLSEAAVDERRFVARINGRVQGVGYRYFARQLANQMGIRGYVRNTHDGAVEVVAEGNEGLLAKFLGALRHGPVRSHVDSIDVSWGDAINEDFGFIVKS